MTGTRRKTTENVSPSGEQTPPGDLLAVSPFEDDLVDRLAAAPPPRRRPPSSTLFLGAGVLAVAGFLGGVQADRHWGAGKTAANPADLLSRFAARGGAGQGSAFGGVGRGAYGTRQGGAFGGGAQGGGATTGTVKLVDGDVVYVQTPNGIVRVKTGGSTRVSVARRAKLSALKTGANVVVQGTPGQDGTVTATSVEQSR